MKLPLRILNLIAATAAAPVIVGCAADPPPPIASEVDQNIETDRSPASSASAAAMEEKPAAERGASPADSEPERVAAPDARNASTPEDDPMPEDDLAQPASDLPLKGMGPFDAPQAAPPFGARGTGSGQDPCPACGMG